MAARTLPIGLLLFAPAFAQGAEPPESAITTLDRIQVSATRTPHAAREVPASVSVVGSDDWRADTLGAAVSEQLRAVPGVLARTRQNHAQDEQLSVRGFGTRASFGIRGARLYVDGIPATMPDGQGQLSHFPLAAAERIEVLRGPFSALYGNAAGGVIQLFTADPAAARETDVELSGGSYGNRRATLSVGGQRPRGDYSAMLSHFATDGYREHSRAERNLLHAKANLRFDRTTLTLLANGLWAPHALDPQGLDRLQWRADPRQASAGALRFDTRKSVTQHQLGAVLAHETRGGDTLRLLAYGGEREVEQFLSIPVATQANPLSGGGVIDLRAPYSGVDARWTRTALLAGQPLEFTLGLSHDTQEQDRRGYENFVGEVLGVRGALRLRQDDRVSARDQYAQATWRPGSWTLSAGVRHSEVEFRSRDRYITADNPDDGGTVRHRATLPVLGVAWQPTAAWRVHAAWGRGFETPTFNELGYRADGGSGLNFALEPARTRSMEAGLGWTRGTAQWELALFRSDTRDELTVNTSSGGRTTFQNAGDARRQGAELSLQWPLSTRWRAQAALTYVEASFRDGFLTCASVPCPVADVPVAAGTRIPGVPRLLAYTALRWGENDLGWHARLEAQHVGEVPVNHRDDERAPGYTVVHASTGYGLRRDSGEGRWFVTVENVFDRRHAGSVIVNESNGRYYEPAPERNVLAGFEWRWRD